MRKNVLLASMVLALAPLPRLHATTPNGGANSLGNIYTLTQNSGGSFTYSDIYDFTGGDYADGGNRTPNTSIRRTLRIHG